jgi:hypothetical protein
LRVVRARPIVDRDGEFPVIGIVTSAATKYVLEDDATYTRCLAGVLRRLNDVE